MLLVVQISISAAFHTARPGQRKLSSATLGAVRVNGRRSTTLIFVTNQVVHNPLTASLVSVIIADISTEFSAWILHVIKSVHPEVSAAATATHKGSKSSEYFKDWDKATRIIILQLSGLAERTSFW